MLAKVNYAGYISFTLVAAWRCNMATALEHFDTTFTREKVPVMAGPNRWNLELEEVEVTRSGCQESAKIALKPS